MCCISYKKFDLKKVVSLHIYPIKGMQGVSVKTAKTLERGFEFDRRYMLINAEGTFISQRTHPDLVFFYPSIVDNQLRVSYKGVEFNISLAESLGNDVEATLFEHHIQATEVSAKANMWFSKYLNEPVRLVKMEEKDIRYKDLIKGPDKVMVSFADGYPYLIAGTASLDRLNEQLESPVPMNRFRPNIVVKTTVPHEEDDWENIRIGKSSFLVIKPCARCPVVTVDQENSIKSKEPLKTLAKYRKRKNMVFFGANAISRDQKEVYIGDEVVVL